MFSEIKIKISYFKPTFLIYVYFFSSQIKNLYSAIQKVEYLKHSY